VKIRQQVRSSSLRYFSLHLPPFGCNPYADYPAAFRVRLQLISKSLLPEETAAIQA
jgi:hypothetical protein